MRDVEHMSGDEPLESWQSAGSVAAGLLANLVVVGQPGALVNRNLDDRARRPRSSSRALQAAPVSYQKSAA
ncbi:MAG: hypothetical protein AAFR23_01420 [Pseudomonadota bacterium]